MMGDAGFKTINGCGPASRSASVVELHHRWWRMPPGILPERGYGSGLLWRKPRRKGLLVPPVFNVNCQKLSAEEFSRLPRFE